MSIPSNPTLTELVTRGLKDSGSYSPSATEISDASTYWIEEIKNDIWLNAKRMKSLQAIAHGVLVKGQSRYSYPSDFSSNLVMTLLSGTDTGIAQAGGSGSITLASNFSSGQNNIIGLYILIISGTGVASCSQIVTYDDLTKVATVAPNFKTAPGVGSGYLIITSEKDLDQKPVDQMKLFSSINLSAPTCYFPIGDEDYGEFILNAPPDKVYGVRLKYYANLMKLDIDSLHMSNLYLQWRIPFIEGIKLRNWSKRDDTNSDNQRMLYMKIIRDLIMKETYGHDMHNLTERVSYYGIC